MFSKQTLALLWARYGYQNVSFNAGLHLAFRKLPPAWRLTTAQAAAWFATASLIGNRVGSAALTS